jgi:ParB family chromosome partitioning protein
MSAKPLQGLLAISLDELHPSAANPRENLKDIEGLASSIREVGLIQPLVVQKVPGKPGYQIVAGHRRHAAAKLVGWATVPCVVRRDMLPDEELLAMLVENGQRANLDPIEEARALNRLKAMGLTDLEIGRKVGRPQNYISNRLVLLTLPFEEQEQLRAGAVTIGASVAQARVTSGRTRPAAKGKKSAQYLSVHHGLATFARARCQRLAHKAKGGASVGGIACGECWESVIRADERSHLHQQSEQRGRCVLCDTQNPASEPTAMVAS